MTDKQKDKNYTSFDPLLYNSDVDKYLNQVTLGFKNKLNKPSHKSINCFLMNLLCKPDKIIRTSFNDKYYNNLRENPNNLKREAIIKIKGELESLGYLEVVHKGYYDKKKNTGTVTRIAATNKFWDYLNTQHGITKKTSKQFFKKKFLEDPIIYKNPRPNFQIKSCPKIKKIQGLIVFSSEEIRSILNGFNALMQQVEIKDPDGHLLPITQFTQRVRHETELVYGRIHDSILQSLKKNIRRHLTINGEPVVEVDFISYSLSIIHAIENVQISSSDPYQFDSLNVSRTVVKKCINSMLNTYSRKSVISALNNDPKCVKSLKYHKVKAEQVISSILNERQFLEGYAFKGVGYYLTYLDAQITLHIIKSLTVQEIPVIPIHDSFVVQQGYQQRLINDMELAFKEILKQKIDPPLKTILKE